MEYQDNQNQLWLLTAVVVIGLMKQEQAQQNWSVAKKVAYYQRAETLQAVTRCVHPQYPYEEAEATQLAGQLIEYIHEGAYDQGVLLTMRIAGNNQAAAAKMYLQAYKIIADEQSFVTIVFNSCVKASQRQPNTLTQLRQLARELTVHWQTATQIQEAAILQIVAAHLVDATKSQQAQVAKLLTAEIEKKIK